MPWEDDESFEFLSKRWHMPVSEKMNFSEAYPKGNAGGSMKYSNTAIHNLLGQVAKDTREICFLWLAGESWPKVTLEFCCGSPSAGRPDSSFNDKRMKMDNLMSGEELNTRIMMNAACLEYQHTTLSKRWIFNLSLPILLLGSLPQNLSPIMDCCWSSKAVASFNCVMIFSTRSNGFDALWFLRPSSLWTGFFSQY